MFEGSTCAAIPHPPTALAIPHPSTALAIPHPPTALAIPHPPTALAIPHPSTALAELSGPVPTPLRVAPCLTLPHLMLATALPPLPCQLPSALTPAPPRPPMAPPAPDCVQVSRAWWSFMPSERSRGWCAGFGGGLAFRKWRWFSWSSGRRTSAATTGT